MRYREPFTIFPRKLKSGKTVYYYRTYSPDGERTVAHSTGQTSKTKARLFCMELLEKGELCNGTGKTFASFATHFYDDGSEWMIDKIQSNGNKNCLSENSLKLYRHFLKKLLLPYFGKIKLQDLRTEHIKNYRTKLSELGYSNNTINSSINCMKVIVKSAMSHRLLNFDPFVSIKPMYTSVRQREAFTYKELLEIFTNWKTDVDVKLFSVIAALTGMRLGELVAIRKETLHDNYIDVRDQMTLSGKLSSVKTKEARNVRICKEMYKMLSVAADKTDFPFSRKSVDYRQIFYRHCLLSKEERMEKKLTFHSLRHFFNTYLLANGISEIKVKSLMGHSSGKKSMTERYTNFRPEDFDDVAEIQSRLFKVFFF